MSGNEIDGVCQPLFQRHEGLPTTGTMKQRIVGDQTINLAGFGPQALFILFDCERMADKSRNYVNQLGD